MWAHAEDRGFIANAFLSDNVFIRLFKAMVTYRVCGYSMHWHSRCSNSVAKEQENADALLTAFCLNSNNPRLGLNINIVIPKGTTQCLKRHK